MRSKEDTIKWCMDDLYYDEERIAKWFAIVRFAKRGDIVDRAGTAGCVAVIRASGVLPSGSSAVIVAGMVITTSYMNMVGLDKK